MVRVAVVGAGGVGGYFGARLADAGVDLTFIARGAHLEAMRQQGLQVESPEGNIGLQSIVATDDPTEVGTVDAVLVAVKAWQLSNAIETVRPLLGPDTAVVPLLNGVEAPGVLARALGPKHVLGGLCGIVAYVDGPGRIKHVGVEPFVRFGELDNSITPRVEALRTAFERAEVGVEIPADIQGAMWQKFLFIAPTSGVGATTRATLGVLRAMPETRAMVERSMREVLEVGQAEGVGLADEHLLRAISMFDATPAEATTSMQRDIAAGRPSELEAQTGAIVRMAKRHGVAAPVNEILYHCLLPLERRARGELVFTTLD